MVGESRFVKSAAVWQAVNGRETEVLDAIGVEWRARRPHIACPYPDHVDNNASWRWDIKKATARCTCTGGNDIVGGNDIFDVVTKCCGIEFEASKLRVAEVLDLGNLIHVKGRHRGYGRQHQATDAAILLSAPIDRRNDTLPEAYLANGDDTACVDPREVKLSPCRGCSVRLQAMANG